jgi:hypothetical protein
MIGCGLESFAIQIWLTPIVGFVNMKTEFRVTQYEEIPLCLRKRKSPSKDAAPWNMLHN